VFTAFDLFLFFFFWEVMLIPMYFIIAIWGHENKNYAAMKFFIFTQVTGLLMLVSILALAYFHHNQFGTFSFNYYDLLRLETKGSLEIWIMLGFFVAFTTKLPSVPFHSWLPDAHSQAPTPGSVILAGVLLKTGAYGLIRFAVPLFPEASMDFAPVAMTLAAISILYCAKVALAQTDIKRLIAYTSVSHMGFVTLGVYAWNEQALQGAVITILAHGLSAAALFMLAGGLQHRIHTRNMLDMGGFWPKVPRMAAVALFFSIAALGMPGLGNFIGEFLALLGAFQSNIPLTVISALGLIFASVYSLWVIQKIFHGEYASKNFDDSNFLDLNRREMVYFGAMIVGLVWMGMYPQSFLGLSAETINNLLFNSENLVAIVGQN
jgi:NADH-quinone oxidoreductase subunit M